MSAPPPVVSALEAGLPVIPCRIDKKPLGKWKRWQEELPDRERLDAWAGNPEVTCWAVVTGAISNRVVIDFDGPEGKGLLERFGLAPHGRTGRGGAHVHFEHPGWYVATLNGKAKRELGERWPGLDVKGDGGYAIFHGRSEFGAYDYQPLAAISPLPTTGLPDELRRGIGLLEPTISASTILERYLSRAVAPVGGDEGNRNNLGFVLACQLRDNAIDRGEAEQTLREFARRCPVGDYPLHEQDALASLAQAYSRPKRRNWTQPARITELGGEASERGAEGAFTLPDSRATAQPHPAEAVEAPPIAHSKAILDRFKAEVRGCGMVGEERNAATIYLAICSRLLDRQVSVAVKGHSASGKSWTVETVVSFFPDDEVIEFTAMSERTLIYSKRDFRHRTLVVYEATALREGIEDNLTAYFVRSLLSEGRIEYEVTVRDEDGHFATKQITKQGPTNLLLTTTQVRVHAENETRLLSIDTDDSAEQTKRVLFELAEGSRAGRDVEDWHALQRWLRVAEHRVEIPYGRSLAELVPPVATRLRRDFAVLLAFIRAHAMLHQLSRGRDEHGRIVADIEDYAVVRELVVEPLGAGVAQTVTADVRETVAAVDAEGGLAPADPKDEQNATTGVMARGVGERLGVDKSNASRRLRKAAAEGFLRNLETRRGRPGRWVLGDPLPEDRELLPSAERLREVAGGVATAATAEPRMNSGIGGNGCAVARGLRV